MQCTTGPHILPDQLSPIEKAEAPAYLPVLSEGGEGIAALARRHIVQEVQSSAPTIPKASRISVGEKLDVITKRAALCISPSVLAADFSHLADEVKRAETAGADAFHVDVMDGHFVKNLSMGPDIVAAINRSTSLPLHVHLMVERPSDYVDRFVQAGADVLFFHFEAAESVKKTLLSIRHRGIRAGLAINPDTNTAHLQRFLPFLDSIIVMSVYPGFGGQGFLPQTTERLRELRRYVDAEERSHLLEPISIAVDGGITLETGRLCVQNGATTLISGTHLFRSPDMGKAIADMKSLAAVSD